jgi:ABC-type amino acid transport substrate-binding protein
MRVASLPLLLVVAAVPLAGRAAARPDEGGDLDAIKARGVLRHLGIPYASFVTGGGDGLDVELVRRFAEKLGVRYEYVETDWPSALPDLVGRKVSAGAPDPEAAHAVPIRGDILATGLTVLPWRARAVAFSAPVFPTQVWIVARAESPVRPIVPTGTLEGDVRSVKDALRARSVIGVANTCLDPALYGLDRTGADLRLRKLRLDEVAPALVNGDSDLALLDVADAMLALQRFPGRLKIIGPISARQEMAAAFRKGSPRLREAFDAFLAEARRDGSYGALIRTYFPEAPVYFADFFAPAR